MHEISRIYQLLHCHFKNYKEMFLLLSCVNGRQLSMLVCPTMCLYYLNTLMAT